MSQLLPKTIQIFLPNGDPQGIRIAEITTRIVRVIEVPRSKMSEFLEMPESKQVGIYLLIGESEDTGAPQIYVGQSGSVGGRLVDHNKKKDFWGRALIAVSLTNSSTSTHATYLESLWIKLATECGRLETLPSYATSAGIKVRQRLLDQGILKQEGDRVVFQRDHLFNSPSTAAQMLMGRTTNGWIEWKDAKGVPLDALRQVVVGDSDSTL